MESCSLVFAYAPASVTTLSFFQVTNAPASFLRRHSPTDSLILNIDGHLCASGGYPDFITVIASAFGPRHRAMWKSSMGGLL